MDDGLSERRARLRLVEPMYAALDEPEDVAHAEDADPDARDDAQPSVTGDERDGPGRRDHFALLVFVALFPAALVHALVGLQLDGDTYHYVEYWRKLVAGVRHATSLHEAAPKPLPIVLHGLLWQLTGSFQVLAWTWILLGGVTVALLARLVDALAGRTAARCTLALLALHPLWVHQTIGGSAATLQALFLVAAALVALLRAPPRTWGVTIGALLCAAGLARPDAWPIALATIGAAPLCVWWRRVEGAPRARFVLCAGALGALAIPLWLAFDLALTGDAWFSFRSTASYGARHATSEEPRPLWFALVRFAPRVASNLTEVLHGGVLVAALVGAAALARARGAVAATLAVAASAVIAFYVFPFASGLPLLPRFLVVPLVVAAAFAGIGVVVVARRVSLTPWLSVPVLLLAVGAHEVLALQRFATVRARLDAEATAGLLEALASLSPEARPTPARPLIVEARRKGLAVLALGVDSDAVTTVRHVSLEAWRAEPHAFSAVIFDPRDLVEPFASEWFLLGAESAPTYGAGTRVMSRSDE